MFYSIIRYYSDFLFQIILSFYQSDKLCLNPAVDIESLAAEISYFDLTFYLIDREVPTIDEKDFQTSKGQPKCKKIKNWSI